MATSEAWLAGPVPGITPLLQPAAHALMQAREDISLNVPGTPAETLWKRQNGAASAGFHLLHMAGALDRLFTYARAESLTDEQKAAARAEAQDRPDMDGAALVAFVSAQIDRGLDQLRSTGDATLLDDRKIGRAGLPSTVIGCLFHGAEHTARHAGQCVSTLKILADPDAR